MPVSSFLNFNPHSHEGSDISCLSFCNRPCKFQSTLPRRERPYGQNTNTFYPYFNPHSHEGSDDFLSFIPCHSDNFNPHSHEGSDLLSIFQTTQCQNFNPHSHEGSDPELLSSSLCIFISIHTPTKGATAILTNNFVIFCSISLIKFILYLKIIQILFIFRYKFIFLLHILSANLPLFLCLLYTRITIKSIVDQLVFLYLHQNVLL